METRENDAVAFTCTAAHHLSCVQLASLRFSRLRSSKQLTQTIRYDRFRRLFFYLVKTTVESHKNSYSNK